MAGTVAAVGTGMLCPGRFLDLATPTSTTELSSSVRGTSSSGCDSLGFGRFASDSLRQHTTYRSVAQPRGVDRSGTTSYASSGPRGKAFEVADASTSRQLGSKSLSNLRGGQRWSGKGAGDVGRQSQQRIEVFQETGGREFELEEDRTRTLHVVADDGTEDNGFRSATAVLNQAWEMLRQDVLYLDWRARNDVYAIMNAHDKVVEVLNPLARERKPASITRQQLADLQGELARAHTQVHILESRVEHSLKKLAEMEAGLTDDRLKRTRPDTRRLPQLVSQVSTVESTLETLEVESTVSASVAEESTIVNTEESSLEIDRTVTKQLNVSGRIAPYPTWLKNFWFPVAFTKDFGKDTLVPIESFEETWVLFRGEDGLVGCVRDECAHRACPLSLGTVVDGRVQCPYHGWEYSTGGDCKKMPSVRPLKASVRALPCIERDGMVWIWPGDDIPADSLPDLNPPSNFSVHAEIVLELPVEHGLLMENLLDLAHAPFTHTSTFAKGWPVPSFVKFRTPTFALSGNWDPYPIDMSFQPPCMVLSTIGLVQPGQLDGASTAACPKHLHQLHVCMPSTRGKTRLLYRMALDFAHWAKYVPFINKLWLHLANQVLNEDLRLVEGQQNRMERGANVWKTPVAYDKLGVRYRRWRNAVEAGDKRLPFEAYVKVVKDS